MPGICDHCGHELPNVAGPGVYCNWCGTAMHPAPKQKPQMHDKLTMRFLGDNMTLNRIQWIELQEILDQTHESKELSSRIGKLLDA